MVQWGSLGFLGFLVLGCFFIGAYFLGAYFWGAYFWGAYFCGAYFWGAYFCNDHFSDEFLSQIFVTLLYEEIMWPIFGYTLDCLTIVSFGVPSILFPFDLIVLSLGLFCIFRASNGLMLRCKGLLKFVPFASFSNTVRFFIKFVSRADSSNLHQPTKWPRKQKMQPLKSFWNKPPSNPATFEQERP